MNDIQRAEIDEIAEQDSMNAHATAAFGPDDEDGTLELIAESVRSFCDQRLGPSAARAAAIRRQDVDQDLWRQLAQLGWLGCQVPEREGGSGLGLKAAARIAEGLGYGVCLEPFTAVAVLAAGLLAGCDVGSGRSQRLWELAQGRLVVAAAWQERDGLDHTFCETEVRGSNGAARLFGRKIMICPGDPAVGGFLVSARGTFGLELHWVDASETGVQLKRRRGADGSMHAELVLEGARGERLLASGVEPALQSALDDALVIAAAELQGLMSRAFEMTLEYIRVRKQFGQPLAAFQVLQHRACDMLIARDVSAACLAEVLEELPRAQGPRRSALASRVKARAASSALTILKSAVQMHGGIGFTEECALSSVIKRTLVLATWLGSPGEMRARYAAHSGIAV